MGSDPIQSIDTVAVRKTIASRVQTGVRPHYEILKKRGCSDASPFLLYADICGSQWISTPSEPKMRTHPSMYFVPVVITPRGLPLFGSR